ncbi:MAG: flippase [Candidatus Bathyarchaeota archaeon]|nr:flippase [Candidatus Bathyarchaeota archaeon]
MARISAKGSFHLLWGIVVSTLISAIGTIYIARLLGADNYGLYAIAVTAPNLFANFRDWGINTAMVKYSAQHNSENNVAKVRSVFFSGAFFELIFGLFLTILSFALSDFLAVAFNRPDIGGLIQISSFTIVTGGLINVATAAFTGLEKMHLNSIMLIVQSIIKTGLIIGLVLLGFGTFGAVWGFTVAVLVAGLTGMLLMYMMYKSLPRVFNCKLELVATAKVLFKYGLPISIGSILAGFLTQFYIYVMAIFVSNNALIGNYNVATNFVVLITFFATPVTTMLFPAFSKLDAQKDGDILRSVFQFSVKYAALIVVPVAFIIVALASPVIVTIFQDRYVEAPLYLALLSITYLYSAFGSFSTGNLINSQGFTSYNLKITILTVAIGFPLGFVLISQFGVIGLILTSLTAGLPGLFLSLRFVRKQFGVSVDWVSSVKILFSSGIAGLVTYLLVSLMPFSSLVQVVVGTMIFVAMFLSIAILIRTFNGTDISNLREIANGLGLLRRPLNWLLDLIEGLMRRLRISKN